MEIEAVKAVVDRINDRKTERKRLDLLKKVIEQRSQQGLTMLMFENEKFMVPSKDVKRLLDKTIKALNDEKDVERLRILMNGEGNIPD